jgi:hypothetical protein
MRRVVSRAPQDDSRHTASGSSRSVSSSIPARNNEDQGVGSPGSNSAARRNALRPFAAVRRTILKSSCPTLSAHPPPRMADGSSRKPSPASSHNSGSSPAWAAIPAISSASPTSSAEILPNRTSLTSGSSRHSVRTVSAARRSVSAIEAIAASSAGSFVTTATDQVPPGLRLSLVPLPKRFISAW